MQVEEFAPGMRPTRQFGARRRCFGEQWLVTTIVVDQQMALPVLQEVLRMPAATASLIVEDNDARPKVEIVTAIGLQVGLTGFSVAGF